jgi:hypothetical protein
MQFNFDATAIPPAEDMGALPPGDYLVIVTKSEEKVTKSGTGAYIELQLEVQDGKYSGRRLWDRLNHQNQNPRAVEIAQRQLSSLCHATGVLQLSDTEQLHNKPVIAVVGVQNDDRGMGNVVKTYKNASAAKPAFTPPRAAAPAPAAAPAGFPPPWQARV